MLICCVKTGEKYSDDYVLKLRNGIERSIGNDRDFICFTDKPFCGAWCEPLPADLPGWWAKVGLFKLKRPLVYFDLDVVITGPLHHLVDWDGFGIIKDWWLPTFNSSVMKLTGEEHHVWDRFTPEVMRTHYMGDQQWVSEQMRGARTFPPEWFPSYKANHCQQAVPDHALAVIFHGSPKPCQIDAGWVTERWL